MSSQGLKWLRKCSLAELLIKMRIHLMLGSRRLETYVYFNLPE